MSITPGPRAEPAGAARPQPIELSLVIPVFNGGRTIGPLVRTIHETFRGLRFEVVLIDDGSSDDSEEVCAQLAEKFSETVSFLELARNFGEHNAVLAGLNHSVGQYVAVLDDDGQNPPEEVLRMLDHIKTTDLDVVYGRYVEKKHHWLRNLGSRFNDRMANVMLKKPPDIYLSSFKVMNRFLVDQVVKYRGPFPYIDGLIYRTTRRIGQIDVRHRERAAGRSGYTFRKLVELWLNMFLGFSTTPLRITVVLGVLTSGLSALLLLGVLIDKIWLNPELTVGIPTVLACIVFFAGVQLIVIGTIGEYVGRIFLEQKGLPQYVVRYLRQGRPDA